jgi:hypothetical protein
MFTHTHVPVIRCSEYGIVFAVKFHNYVPHCTVRLTQHSSSYYITLIPNHVLYQTQTCFRKFLQMSWDSTPKSHLYVSLWHYSTAALWGCRYSDRWTQLCQQDQWNIIPYVILQFCQENVGNIVKYITATTKGAIVINNFNSTILKLH